jgi:hypothetical protein
MEEKRPVYAPYGPTSAVGIEDFKVCFLVKETLNWLSQEATFGDADAQILFINFSKRHIPVIE